MAREITEALMRRRADAYFAALGDGPPTLAGLALALELPRAELVYGRYRGPGKEAVARAFLRYEAYLEAQLHEKDGFRGAEFCLMCNCGWARQAQGENDQELLARLARMLGSGDDEVEPEAGGISQ